MRFIRRDKLEGHRSSTLARQFYPPRENDGGDSKVLFTNRYGAVCLIMEAPKVNEGLLCRDGTWNSDQGI